MSRYLVFRDGGKTDQVAWYHFMSKLLAGNTVGTSFSVSQRGAGANMSVDIATGDAMIPTGSGYAYQVYTDAIENAVITTANGSNPRNDIVVAYVDITVVQSVTADNPNALIFAVIAGTPAASPADPSDATIQAAVGASNPFIKLARVRVGTSVSSITNANITDLRTAVTGNFNQGGSDGWNTLGFTMPSTVVYNGNRSYSLTFSGVDLTAAVSTGMRIRTTRTSAAPTKCTSLNGTTQFYNRSAAITGMTFTDDFAVSAWVKLTAYPAAVATIASRYNGTSGWDLEIEPTTGQIVLIGFNAGGGNSSYIISQQSVPLNKWVHIAAQLDMSSFTVSPTTSYLMMDGVDIPATVARGGTNPTALIQAGNIEIGSRNGGLQPFAGKIAQVAIYGAKVTEATMQASISQGLAGTETSLVSAYSFNNSINDLNTTNANNLTANGAAVATTSDSPFAQGAAAGSLDFGIVMTNSFSTDTTMVVQVPEGSAIPTSGGISAMSYSSQKIPYGFPSDPAKWSVEMICSVDGVQTNPTQNVWYNPLGLNLNIPIGVWDTSWQALTDVGANPAAALTGNHSMSTSPNSESDGDFTTYSQFNSAFQGYVTYHRRKPLNLAVATPYYLIARNAAPASANNTIGFNNSLSRMIVRATCGHL